jgi:phosphatidylglycerol:prolipoprotein diacylglycerol transferase
MYYPEIDPIIMQLGPLAIRWYGLMYLLGFAVFWWLGRMRARQAQSVLTVSQIEDLVFYCALGTVLGGRIGYVLFYASDRWLVDPLVLLRVWEGGMSFHGGLLGVLLALILFSRRYQLPLFRVTDFVVPMVPVGLFFGRIGNFINGELWGAPTSVSWGMQVACANRYDLCVNKLQLAPGTAMTPPLHPSQLYEAALEGLVLFVLLWWYSAKPRTAPVVSGLFLLGYGSFRFIVEWVRLPDSHLGYLAFDWLTMGQVLSLPMVLAGVILLVIAYRRTGV